MVGESSGPTLNTPRPRPAPSPVVRLSFHLPPPLRQGYDGGDCCICTCFVSPTEACGEDGEYDCKDPSASCSADDKEDDSKDDSPDEVPPEEEDGEEEEEEDEEGGEGAVPLNEDDEDEGRTSFLRRLLPLPWLACSRTCLFFSACCRGR